MKVVVVGATGNVWRSVVEALAEDPAVTEIVGVARRTPSSWRPARTRFEAADVRSSEVAQHLMAADAVVLLTWAFQPTHQPLTTWDINVLGSMNVLQAAADAGVATVVYASSLAAYSPGPGRHVDEKLADQQRANGGLWPREGVPGALYRRLRVASPGDSGRADAYLFHLQAVLGERTAADLRWAAGPAGIAPSRPAAGRPFPAGLRFQAMHGDDAGEAYRLALLSDARGAYNVAADPIIDREAFGRLLEARAVQVPKQVVSAAMAGAWRLRLIPADESLLKMFVSLPTLDSSRIRAELGWQPQRSGADALREVMEAMAEGAGGPTPPLSRCRAQPHTDHRRVSKGPTNRGDTMTLTASSRRRAGPRH